MKIKIIPKDKKEIDMAVLTEKMMNGWFNKGENAEIINDIMELARSCAFFQSKWGIGFNQKK